MGNAIEVYFVFDDETGLWDSSEESYIKIIRGYHLFLSVIQKKEKGLYVKQKNYSTDTLLIRKMMPQLRS